jgi:hypothetical protein
MRGACRDIPATYTPDALLNPAPFLLRSTSAATGIGTRSRRE